MSGTSDLSGMAKSYSYNTLHRLEDDGKLPVNSNKEAIRYEIEVSYMRGADIADGCEEDNWHDAFDIPTENSKQILCIDIDNHAWITDSDSWIWHSQADHHRLYKWIYIVDLLSR